MALAISQESYNSLPALYANAGKWVSGQFELKNNYYKGSGNSNTITALGTTLTIQSGNWMDFGFAVGDSITITFTSYLAGNSGVKTYTKTVTYINGNIMYIDTALASPFTNLVFPTSGQVAGMAVSANKLPATVEFTFNLCKNGTQAENSVIDSELNRFTYNSVASMAVNDVVNMVQLGNKSGGMITNVQLRRLADTTAGVFTYKNFRVTYSFLQWGIYEDANLYGAGDCLVPFIKAKTYPLAGNPNGAQTDTNGAKEANTGYFGENYNGGSNPYVFNSISWTDANGDPIDQMDYSGESNFTATITAPNQLDGSSNYRIGLAFRPQTDDLYKNIPTSAFNNLMVNAPDVNFQHSASPSVTVYSGNTNADGARFDLTNLKFSHSAGTLTVSGTVQPNGSCQAFFDELTDGERNMVMWVQVSNYTTSGTTNDEVNVLIYNDDCYDAPTLGVQIPNIVSETLYDHAGQDITNSATPNTTTEDDVLYEAIVQLYNGVTYESISVGISARNSVSGDTFELERITIPFTNVPFVGGQYQLNETIARGFNLPPSTDRNAVRVTLDPTNDGVGSYGVKIEYGFLNRWEYWLAQTGVSDDFFVLADPNNGQNKEWQHYNSGNWQTFVDMYTVSNDVEDFNHFLFKIRSYEDDPTVTCDVTFTAPDGTTPTNLLNNTLHEVAALFTWTGTFTNPWVEVTIEDFESGNRWVMSSELDQGGIAQNPLKPVTGETAIKLTNGGNTLLAELLVDTNLVAASNVSMSFRVFSEPKLSGGYEITQQKEALISYSTTKTSNDTVYSGPLFRIRRSNDDAELDINALPDGLPDTTAMTDFVEGNDGFFVKFYDQAGNGNHGVQTDKLKQVKCISAGSLVTEAGNGILTIKFSGVEYYVLTSTVTQDKPWSQVMVVNRGNFPIFTLGNTGGDSTLRWEGVATGDIYTGFGAVEYNHGANITTGNMLLWATHDTNDETKVYVDGSLFSTLPGDTYAAHSLTWFGRSGSGYLTAPVQEFIAYEQDKTTEMAGINTILTDKYGL